MDIKDIPIIKLRLYLYSNSPFDTGSVADNAYREGIDYTLQSIQRIKTIITEKS